MRRSVISKVGLSARPKGKKDEKSLKILLELYGLKTEAEALAYKGNPVDSLGPNSAKAGIPLIHVIGDADLVPPNGTRRFSNSGSAWVAPITVFHKPGLRPSSAWTGRSRARGRPHQGLHHALGHPNCK